MGELADLTSTPRTRNQTVQLSALAERQWGVVSRRQLLALGLSNATISRQIAAGRLHRIHPRVYALGHPRLSTEGRLVAALHYAGPGAALSHATAAWWWKLIDHEPLRIEISAPGYVRSLPDVHVHHPRHVDQARHRGLPTTTVAQTLLDFAARAPNGRLRQALAEADYRRMLDRAAVDAVLIRGHPGVAALRHALQNHYPEFARTRSELERAFLSICIQAGSRVPKSTPGSEA